MQRSDVVWDTRHKKKFPANTISPIPEKLMQGVGLGRFV